MGQWWCVWLKLSPSRIGFYQQAEQLGGIFSPAQSTALPCVKVVVCLRVPCPQLFNHPQLQLLRLLESEHNLPWIWQLGSRKTLEEKYLWLFFIKNFSVGANELRSSNLFCVLSLCCVICQEYRMVFFNPVRHIHIISISISIISISWIKRKHCCLEHRMTRPSPVLLSPCLLCCLPTFKLISDQR